MGIYNLMRAVTHPYPGAFTTLAGRKLFIWNGRPLAAPVGNTHLPGQITACLPGDGLLVATGEDQFLITQAQWEGEPEFLGPVLATWEYLVGQKFD
jgi:methionyl-tRNA formyltransferase